jgi:2-polyprenyl-6-methoxyphenol hydroxylase-like FAD-dependent oxidoreductase
VIAGAGLGGLRTAEALRAHGFEGEIVIFGDEAHAPYNRPPLSKEALYGEISYEKLAFRVRSTATDLTWRLNDPIAASDLDAHTVTLASGEVVSYDALVAATGVSARRLPIPGPPATAAGGRHVIRTLDDAIALRKHDWAHFKDLPSEIPAHCRETPIELFVRMSNAKVRTRTPESSGTSATAFPAAAARDGWLEATLSTRPPPMRQRYHLLAEVNGMSHSARSPLVVSEAPSDE